MTTLVLIPGLISDSIVWQPVADAALLPSHHADVTRDDSITAMAERLLEETAGEIIVVGHSMGGRVALEMARIAPSRVRGLVLANTGHGPKRDAELPKRYEMIERGHQDMAALADVWLPPMMHPERSGNDPDLVAKLKEMVLRAGPDVHERQIKALIGRPNATEYLSQISCPILLLTGRQDGWSPIAQHQEIADVVPDAELAIIEDAGHFAPVEQPEAVTSQIVSWLERRFGYKNG